MIKQDMILKYVQNKMNCCYLFLECSYDDSISKLRENFLYKINEALKEQEGIYIWHSSYFDGDKNDPKYFYFEEDDSSRELRALEKNIMLLCDSYIAILLSKKNYSQYESIIEGLTEQWVEEGYLGYIMKEGSNGWEYNPYFPLRFPRENESVEMAEVEYVSKEQYIEKLNSINCYSSNDGFKRFTSSLSIIISLEKEMMDENQVLKFYQQKYLPIGHIIEENGNAKRQKIIEQKRLNKKQYVKGLN